jgi:hypothetical protein
MIIGSIWRTPTGKIAKHRTTGARFLSYQALIQPHLLIIFIFLISIFSDKMVQLSRQLRKAVLAGAGPDELENILKDMDHTTMLTDGKRLVSDGITTEEELNMFFGVFQGDSYAA